MNKSKKLIFALAFFTCFNQAFASDKSLLDGYNESADYEPVFELAVKANTPIGNLYANRLLGECRLVHENLDNWKIDLSKSDLEVSLPRKDAIRSLISRCQNLTDSRINDNFQMEVNKSRVDPLAAVEFDIGIVNKDIAISEKTNGRNAKKTSNLIDLRHQLFLKSAKEVNDPLYVDDLGIRLILSKDSDGKTIFKVGKKEYPVNSKIDPGLATFLVPCELGLTCDSREFKIALSCASGVACDNGRYEKVRRIAKEVDADFDELLKLSKEIARNISSGKSK